MDVSDYRLTPLIPNNDIILFPKAEWGSELESDS